MATAADLATYLTFSPAEEYTLQVTERTASAISILSCLLVFVTFLSSKRFRKPVNRLLFYATIGNFFMNIGTSTSLNGIYLGRYSALCQFQGFLIQMFLPADAFWNLSMAINTYLAVFKKWPSSRLQRLDKWYFLVNYGATLIIAVVYCFISDAEKGKMYGPAVLWCWIDSHWDVWRVITCYAPAWIAIFASFCIYLAVGLDIYSKRNQLRAFRPTTVATGSTRRPLATRHWSEHHIKTTTEFSITTKAAGSELDDLGIQVPVEEHGYACTAEAIPFNPFTEFDPNNAGTDGRQLARATLEANSAATGYAKCAMFFFVSLVITWVPSSIFRVSAVVSPDVHVYGTAYATGLVLPLQGFWNAIIYVFTSKSALKAWFMEDVGVEKLLLRTGIKKPPPIDPASLWPPTPTPTRTRSEKFVRRGSQSGSFDRLC